MSKQIIKPTSIERMEFMRTLTDLINNSVLPPYVIEPILKDYYEQIRELTVRQYKEDIAQYSERMKAMEASQ